MSAKFVHNLYLLTFDNKPNGPVTFPTEDAPKETCYID